VKSIAALVVIAIAGLIVCASAQETRYEPAWESIDARPGPKLALAEPKPAKNTVVTLLGLKQPLKWRSSAGKIEVTIPQLPPDAMPCAHAYVLKLTGVK